ncbi:hypothetical protein WJX72_003173 [[Myrmecia] bisecta]|uniref:BTB domain-containing protein n=1 Tax=[Myrmecia] bisecta TaxID=41462 RepID=A0AAW1Q3N0_9CHLO
MSSRNRDKKFRRKVISAVVEREEEEEDFGSLAVPPATAAAKKDKTVQNRKKDKKASLLSFGTDEEAALSKSKKKGSSFKAAGVDALKGIAETSATRTQVSSAGEYSADRLNELKKNALSYPGSKSNGSSSAQAASKPLEAMFKLSGSFKPAQVSQDDRFELPATALATDEPQQAEEALLPPPPRPSRASSSSGAAPAAEDDADDDGFAIPDAEFIKRAKAKRELLRSAHLAPDYIPLGGAAGAAGLAAQQPRGGDEPAGSSGSDEEPGHLRMQFLGAARSSRPAPGVLASVVDTEQRTAGDEEDEEGWAEEQLRRVVGGRAADNMAPRTASAAGARPRPTADQAAEERGLSAESDVLKALRLGLEHLQASRKQADRNLARTAANLADSIKTVATLEDELKGAGEKYTYLQELRAYVADLCDMLQNKSPIVEELEEHLLSVSEQRASAYASRIASEEADELGPASAAVAAALGVVSRGGGLTAATAAAENAASDAEAQAAAAANGPVELDEFGRDLGLMKRREAADRAAQRQARLERDQARVQQREGQAEAQWGDETSDEEDSEVSHYDSRRRDILEASTSVFADAAEEYSNLAAIKQRLEACKRKQAGAYRDAYLSLSAPAIFAPYVRLELLAWDPIFQQSPGFDTQQWYGQLFEFGPPSEAGDPDEDLVPKLVRELVLPLANHTLLHCWNPASKRHTRAAVALLGDLLVYVPPEDKKLQGLLSDVMKRLEEAVERMQLPPWPPAAVAASQRAALLLARRFGKTLRLLHNIGAFEGTLARGPLVMLALDRLLHRQVLPYLRTAAADVPVAVDRAEHESTIALKLWEESSSFAAARLMERARLHEVITHGPPLAIVPEVLVTDDGSQVVTSRLSLACWSEYFRTRFTGSFGDGASCVVNLPDVAGQDLEALIHALYAHQIHLTLDNVESLLSLADRLQVSSVTDACAQFLTEQLPSNPAHVLPMYDPLPV